ncbi:membrane hypothetical protein [Cupriavidus taiwanensis]|nr:membrane hypothetical protein [Cupriavidus taiwanensis]SOY52805.1 membrane hypothetical protein [Cupriavidus taiwanensis]SOY85673.1 membrane hypothetical protein [Cupriavidus taiwanensis]SOZ60241.1 membrane hypothetical protein [Cupriavidus taiwanensis]SOZ80527.1 membrane hypothetical protein [Cupriavidus taiwanensis]
MDLLGLVIWGALVPIVPFALLSLWFEGPARIVQSVTQVSGMAVFAVAYLAFAATVFGYTMWGRLLTRYPASQVAPLTLLVPVVGLVSAHVLLGEDLSGVAVDRRGGGDGGAAAQRVRPAPVGGQDAGAPLNRRARRLMLCCING